MIYEEPEILDNFAMGRISNTHLLVATPSGVSGRKERTVRNVTVPA